MSVPGTINFPASLDDAVSLFETANRISTTLNGGINDVATTVTLTSGTGWPNTGSITFNDTGEIAYYTGKTGAQLTGLLRGRDGSAAAAHNSGVTVQLNDTSRHHQVQSEAIIAAQTKIGSGSSTPTTGLFLRGSSAGVSAWSAIQAGDVPSHSAALLTSGTVPDARFPATLPAASGINLTALNASNLGSGTVPDARFPATLPALSGLNLTNLNATNLASGTVADARLSSNVPLKNGANTFTALQTINPGTTPSDGIFLDIAQPGSFAQRDSHKLVLRGTGFDTSGHNADWRQFVDVQGESGLSQYLFQSRIDGAGYATRFAIQDTGEVTFSSSVQMPSLYVGGGSLAGSATVTFSIAAATVAEGYKSVDIFGGPFTIAAPRTLTSQVLIGPYNVNAASAQTVTHASTLTISGAPTAIGSAVITNPWAIYVQAGNVGFSGLIKAGSALTTLTDSTGKILTTALNTVGVAQGGTGLATLTAYGVMCAGTTATGDMQQVSGTGTSGQVLTSNGAGALPTWQNNASGFADPMTTRGDIIIRNNVNTTARLGVGAADTVLKSDGTDVAYGQVTNAMLAGSITAAKLVKTDITQVGTITSGGLGAGATVGGVSMVLGSDATGDIYYRNAGGALNRLAIGATGKHLTVVAGIPAWSTPTFPNASGTAGLYLVSDGTNFVTRAAPGVVTTLTDGVTIATNAALGSRFRVTLGGNRTLGNPTGAVDGQQIVWEIIQDATGTRTLTLDSKFAFGTDITSITLTTTINKRDFLTAIYNATADKFYVVGFVKGY